MHFIGNAVFPSFDEDDDEGGGGGGGGGGSANYAGGDPYTLADVAKHKAENDVWVVINGAVCDLTEFKNVHPGGVKIIMDNAGTDASPIWNGIHGRDTIEKIAPQVRIGHIKA